MPDREFEWWESLENSPASLRINQVVQEILLHNWTTDELAYMQTELNHEAHNLYRATDGRLGWPDDPDN